MKKNNIIDSTKYAFEGLHVHVHAFFNDPLF